MGQYTQQDPIGLAGGNTTLYGYVHNPNWWIDPLGLTRGKNRVVDKIMGRPTPDQQALIALARESSKRIQRGLGPLPNNEVDILIQWAKEYNVPFRAKPSDLSGVHGYGNIPPGPKASHIHINGEHVPVSPGYTPPGSKPTPNNVSPSNMESSTITCPK